MGFFKDFKDNLIGQYEESEAYRLICKSTGFNPYNDLKCDDDLEYVPYLVTTNFKRSNGLFMKLIRKDIEKIDKWTVSSSTSGDPSIVGRTKEDIESLRKFVEDDDKVFRKRHDYECTFFPHPEDMKAYGRSELLGKPVESYLANMLDIFSYIEDTIHLLKLTDKGFIVDAESFSKYILEHNKKDHYAALGGSTPLFYKTVLGIKERMKSVELGDKAIVHTGGGGWDGRKGNINIGAEIQRWRFVEDVSRFLGIPEENFTDTYSFTENSFTMTGHYSKQFKDYIFHVPKWARVIVRDFKTLKPLKKAGDRGLIQVLNAHGTDGFAGASILVDDIAEIVEYNRCPICNTEGMTIKIIGRVKGTEAKGCGATLGGDGQ